MEHAHEIAEELKPKGRALRDAIPGVAGYAQLNQAAVTEGALTTLAKELIALAIAATHECDGCIAAHADERTRRERPLPRWQRPWAWSS